MAYTLNDNLKRWAEQYETAEFIQSDPVQIPHRYDSRVNIEISAFVTAWIAWGSRKQIIQKADFIDREIFKGEPYHYIVGNNVEPGAAPEWKQYKGSKENFYRTFTYADFHDLCARLFDVYSKFENMEKALQAQPNHCAWGKIGKNCNVFSAMLRACRIWKRKAVANAYVCFCVGCAATVPRLISDYGRFATPVI